MSEAFITGSQSYGTPHDKSDVDLVIKTDEATALWLHRFFHPECYEPPKSPIVQSLAEKLAELPEQDPQVSETVPQSASIRIGKLNIIACWSDWAYDIWSQGTSDMLDQKPVTREHAVKWFRALRFAGTIDNNPDNHA